MVSFILLSVIAFFINIPIGYFRDFYPRMSFMWLLILHSPVPFIFYFRWLFDIDASEFNYMAVPILIIISVIGQVIGSRLIKYIVNKSKN